MASIVAFRLSTLLAPDDRRFFCAAVAFEYACATNDIGHRTTKAKHPWTSGQI